MLCKCTAVFHEQLDRLGLRLVAEEDRIFRGFRKQDGIENNVPISWLDLSSVDISATRLGLDLDIIRYPQFRAGVNFDYHLNGVQFDDYFLATSPTDLTGFRRFN